MDTGPLVMPVPPAVAYVLIAAGFLVVVYVALKSDSPGRSLLLWPSICSLFTASAATIGGYYSIVTSKSSTAALGYIFLPVLTVIAAAGGFLLSWALLYVARFVLETAARPRTNVTSGSGLAAALLILCATGLTTGYVVSRHRSLGVASGSTDAGALHRMVDRAISSRDIETLSQLARNGSVSVVDLVRIYESCKSNLSDINAREYDVYLSLASNPQTPAEILTALAGCKQGSIRTDVGLNPSTPVDTLWQLSKDPSSTVRAWLTTNPAVPRELLLQLAKDPDTVVRGYAESYLRYRGICTDD